MTLIDSPITANVDYVAVRANNAAEMQQKLAAAAAALDPEAQVILDFELQATGAAPHFLGILSVGESGGNMPEAAPDAVQFIVLGGIDNVDPEELPPALTAAVLAAGPNALYKFLMAGGGAGPHWMAAAMISE